MILSIANETRISPLADLPVTVADRIKGRLTFSNSAFLEAEKRGFYTGNLEQVRPENSGCP